MAAIDIGTAAINRGTAWAKGYTLLVVENPADGTGKITSVEIWAALQDMNNCKVATFQNVGGNNFTARDSAVIGTVTFGSKQTFPVDLDVETGDYIGMWWDTIGYIEVDSFGSGVWRLAGDQTGCVNATFEFVDTNTISLWGEGETTPAPPAAKPYTPHCGPRRKRVDFFPTLGM